MLDRRKFPRFSPKWQLAYQVLLEEPPVVQRTINVSGNGIRFTADRAIAPGTSVSIEFEPHPHPSKILALARVVWCQQTANAFEVGAEFQWIGWKDDIMNEGNFPQIAEAMPPDAQEFHEQSY